MNDITPVQATEAPVVTRLPRRRGLAARLAIAASSLMVMAVLALLALFLLLSRGPLPAPLIGESVAQALERRFNGAIDVSIGETSIEKTEAGLELHAYRVAFRDMAGKEIITAPEALIAFDPLALLAFRLEPRSIKLRGLAMRAQVRPDGEIRLSTTDNARDAGGEFALREAFGSIVAVARTGTISGLNAFAVTDAKLTIDDQRVGREVVFEKMSAVFAAPGEGSAVVSGSATRSGIVMPYRIEAKTQNDAARLSLNVSNVPLKVAETIGGNTAMAASGDSTLTFHATLLVGSDGQARSGAAEAKLTPGTVMIPALFEGPWRVTGAKLEAEWSAEAKDTGRFRASFDGDGGAGAITGTINLAAERDGFHAITGKTEALSLTPLSERDQPVLVNEGAFKLRVPSAGGKIIVDSLTLKGADTDLRLAGEIRREPDGPAVSAQLTAGRMPLRTAIRWWPTSMAPAGRVWMKDSVEGGVLRQLSLALELPPPQLAAALRDEPIPAEALRLEAAVEDGIVRALDGLPPVSGLVGSGWLDAKRAELQASRGTVDLGQNRRVQLGEGSIQIGGLDTWTPDLAIGFRAQAPAEHMAEIVRSPALRDYFAVDINPQDVRGQFDGRARIAFQLGKPLGKGDIQTDVKATLRNVTLEKAIGSERLETGNLTIQADATGVEVKGDGRWRGMPVVVSLENDSQDRSTATTLSFTLDEAQQRRLGLAGQVTGPLPVRIKALREQGEGLRARAEIDLVRAAIDGLVPGFQKPAGRAGKLSFEATERGKGFQLQNIVLDSGASSIRGTAEVGADGALNSARFSLFRLSPGDNVKLDFDRTPSGGRVTVRGNNLDARPFLRAVNQDGPTAPQGERDLDVDVKTTLLSGNNGEVLTNAELRLQRRNGQTRQIALTGRLNGKQLSVTGQAADRPAPLTINSDDAGAFLRFMDIYTRMQGGDLAGVVRPSPRDVSGFLIARNFSLRNEPALRRLLNEAPPESGVRAQDGAAFTKMRIDFSRTGSATTIREAVIFGPQLGVTFNGLVDQARDRISISGTFIPAYGLNNAFASIPLFGGLLTGGRNEGLLGITFGVSGRASQPEVTVNPLSAVAPGIFRRIFEFRNERTPAAAPPQTLPPIGSSN